MVAKAALLVQSTKDAFPSIVKSLVHDLQSELLDSLKDVDVQRRVERAVLQAAVEYPESFEMVQNAAELAAGEIIHEILESAGIPGSDQSYDWVANCLANDMPLG